MKLLISTKEIAELAGTRLSTVSNWKSRSRTFPKPVGKRNGVNVFDYDETVAWLKTNRKAADMSRNRQLLWIISNGLRAVVSDEDLAASMAVLFGLYKTSSEYGLGKQWKDLVSEPNERNLERYVDRLEELDRKEPLPHLTNLIREARRRVLGMMEALPSILPAIVEIEEKDLPSLLDDAIERNSRERDSGSDLLDFSSLGLDDALVAFAVGVTQNLDHVDVYDPACGLERTGLEFSDKHPDTAFALSDINPTAAMLAEVRFLLKRGRESNAIVRNLDSLAEDGYQDGKADLVLLQPPSGLRSERIDSPMNDSRWTYAPAASTSPEFMFLQDAIYHLKPDGVILMASLAKEASSYGRSAPRIRRRLIAEGRVKAVVSLRNDRRRFQTNADIDIWVVGNPNPKLNAVYMVDGRKPADDRVDMGELPVWLSRSLEKIWGKGSYRWSVVPVKDILANESAKLTPSYWIKDAEWNPRVINEEMAEQTARIHAALKVVDSRQFPARLISTDTPSFKEAQTISLRELVAQDKAELHRGRLFSGHGNAPSDGTVTRDALMKGISTIKPCEQLDDGEWHTNAGDILFTDFGTILAAVDWEGGHRISSGICALTLTGDEWDPRFVAACLKFGWNLRVDMSARSMTRIVPANMELPLVGKDVQSRYIAIMEAEDEIRKLDQAVSKYLESFGNAIRFGTES